MKAYFFLIFSLHVTILSVSQQKIVEYDTIPLKNKDFLILATYPTLGENTIKIDSAVEYYSNDKTKQKIATYSYGEPIHFNCCFKGEIGDLLIKQSPQGIGLKAVFDVVVTDKNNLSKKFNEFEDALFLYFDSVKEELFYAKRSYDEKDNLLPLEYIQVFNGDFNSIKKIKLPKAYKNYSELNDCFIWLCFEIDKTSTNKIKFVWGENKEYTAEVKY